MAAFARLRPDNGVQEDVMLLRYGMLTTRWGTEHLWEEVLREPDPIWADVEYGDDGELRLETKLAESSAPALRRGRIVRTSGNKYVIMGYTNNKDRDGLAAAPVNRETAYRFCKIKRLG